MNKSVLLNIRVSPEISKWLKDNDYSPTGIFYAALAELECPSLWEKKKEFIDKMNEKSKQ